MDKPKPQTPLNLLSLIFTGTAFIISAATVLSWLAVYLIGNHVGWETIEAAAENINRDANGNLIGIKNVPFAGLACILLFIFNRVLLFLWIPDVLLSISGVATAAVSLFFLKDRKAKKFLAFSCINVVVFFFLPKLLEIFS